jgi:hypothetical protein
MKREDYLQNPVKHIKIDGTLTVNVSARDALP